MPILGLTVMNMIIIFFNISQSPAYSSAGIYYTVQFKKDNTKERKK